MFLAHNLQRWEVFELRAAIKYILDGLVERGSVAEAVGDSIMGESQPFGIELEGVSLIHVVLETHDPARVSLRHRSLSGLSSTKNDKAETTTAPAPILLNMSSDNSTELGEVSE